MTSCFSSNNPNCCVNTLITILFRYIPPWLKEKLAAGCTWKDTPRSACAYEDTAGEGLQLAFCPLHQDGEQMQRNRWSPNQIPALGSKLSI